MIRPDLTELDALARKHQCSYSIDRCDSDNTWYISVRGLAPSEQFVGKNRSNIESAIDDAVSFLKEIP